MSAPHYGAETTLFCRQPRAALKAFQNESCSSGVMATIRSFAASTSLRRKRNSADVLAKIHTPQPCGGRKAPPTISVKADRHAARGHRGSRFS